MTMLADRETGPQVGGRSQPPAKVATPTGAARMQAWFIDRDGRRVKTLQPVPVDSDDARTAHVLHKCGSCAEFAWLLRNESRFCPTHGKALTAERQSSRSAATLLDAKRMFAQSAAPWLVPAAGVAADLFLSGNDLLPAIPVLGAGAYLVTRRTLTRRAVRRGRIERGQRAGRKVAAIRRTARRAAMYGVEGGLWLSLLAATDIATWAGRIVWAAGLVRWAIGSKPWWDAVEQRRMRGVKPAVTVATPVTQAEAPDPVHVRAVATWKTLIGGADGVLRGTELVEFKRLPGSGVDVSSRTVLPNWTATVVASVPGSINMREPRPALLGRIAAAFRCTYADVSFAADESDLSVAHLRVQPDNVLAEVRMWRGPDVSNDWDRGQSVIGRFDDGAPIPYQWWSETGALHDLISGCTGSGKSETVAQLILNSLHSNGLVLDWVGDPQGGQSFGALKDQVDWFARDKAEIKLMLLAAVKEMFRRNDVLSNAYVKTWQPTRVMPLLVLTLDEVQSYIDDPDILALVEVLVGQARKCGIKMRLITQIPAAYNLGGSTYIKEQLKAGQTIIHRAMTSIAANSAVEPDVPIDPTQLPMTWGKNTCAAGKTTAGLLFLQGIHARDVYGRADFTGTDMAPWLAGPLSPGVFCPDARLESGVLWGDRRERARRLLAAGRSDHDLLPGGKAVELIEAAAVAASTGTVLRAAPEPEPSVPDRARDVVLAAAGRIADARGVATRDAIVKATPEIADGTRNKAFTQLIASGDLRRVKNGVYEVSGVDRHLVVADNASA